MADVPAAFVPIRLSTTVSDLDPARSMPFSRLPEITFATTPGASDSFRPMKSPFDSLQTSTPGDGTGQFVNAVNPHIILLDPTNFPVATGTVLADGRNESIQYQPTVPGIYRVRVSEEGNTSGEYFLSLNGNLGTAAPFKVAAINPADGQQLSTATGAIVSLDWADPAESWRWAGPEWTGRAPAHRQGGLRGLTIEVTDPAGAAARWAEVLGLTVRACQGYAAGAPIAEPVALLLDMYLRHGIPKREDVGSLF